MIMPPRLRKLALTAHITFSIGWIGAVADYIALDVAAAICILTQDEGMKRLAEDLGEDTGGERRCVGRQDHQ